MKRVLLGALAALALAYYRFFGGPLENTRWDVKVKADSFFAFTHHDTLLFERGRLNASGYQANGFRSVSYNAEKVDGGDIDTIWNASFTDARRGTMTWHGLVRGDKMQGVAILWTRDGKQKRFTFTGKRA